MNQNEYSTILEREEYRFIKENKYLGKNVILLGLAGSYSYGTNNENSDIDVRGVTLNQKSDLIGLTEFEQYVDADTDTTIYSFNKLVTLLYEAIDALILQITGTSCSAKLQSLVAKIFS